MALRVTTMWHIWLTQNAEMIAHKQIPLAKTKAQIWYQMKVYMKTEWAKKQMQILRGKLIEARAHQDFTFDFGTNDTIIQFPANSS